MKINTSFPGNIVNSFALRKAKIAYNFGLSECSRVKGSVLQSLLALNILRSCDDVLSCTTVLTLKGPALNIDDFANSVDPGEFVHDELAHYELHCLHLVFEFSV